MFCISSFQLLISLRQLPERLLREWNAARNNDLLTVHTKEQVLEVSLRSPRKVWWKCEACSHEWLERIVNRTLKASACPKCVENMVNIADEVMACWDPIRNINCGCDGVKAAACTTDRVWWQCPDCNDFWAESVFSFSQAAQRGFLCCPTCEERRNPSHGTPSRLLMCDSVVGSSPLGSQLRDSSKKLRWSCHKCLFEFHLSLRERMRLGRGCPRCAGLVTGGTNLLLARRPDVISEVSSTFPFTKLSKLAIQHSVELPFVCSICKRGYKMALNERCSQQKQQAACPHCEWNAMRNLNSSTFRSRRGLQPPWRKKMQDSSEKN